MREVNASLREAQHCMHVLEPLAAAEAAAKVPPTPDSSQAAYNAAVQRYLMLSDESGRIFSRASECVWPECC